MIQMQTLSRGGSYPFPIQRSEGAAAQFLAGGNNILQISLPGIVPSEAKAIRKAPIKAGFIKDGPLILWVFCFGDIILDCPFDVRKIPADLLSLPNIENGRQRLVIDIHLVDTATNILHGLREFTLSPSLSLRFLESVQDQMVDLRDIGPYLARFQSIAIHELAKLAKVDRCGI